MAYQTAVRGPTLPSGATTLSIMSELCYDECHLYLSVIQLSVTNKPFMLSAVMLNVIVLSVVAPAIYRGTEPHWASLGLFGPHWALLGHSCPKFKIIFLIV
jgi:hypothetical protein